MFQIQVLSIDRVVNTPVVQTTASCIPVVEQRQTPYDACHAEDRGAPTTVSNLAEIHAHHPGDLED